MPLDKRQVETLLSAVAETRDDEIDCEACLADMAEFAESELVGAERSEALHRIRAHLALCADCEEEYQALLEALRSAST